MIYRFFCCYSYIFPYEKICNNFDFMFQFSIYILTYASFAHLGFSARIKRREIINSSSNNVYPKKSFSGTNDDTIQRRDASPSFRRCNHLPAIRHAFIQIDHLSQAFYFYFISKLILCYNKIFELYYSTFQYYN